MAAWKNNEHTHQAALFKWAEWEKRRFPELQWMFAIPNGSHKTIQTAMKFKGEGLKKGVPDVFLPVARLGFHGLFLEMKRGRNKVSEQQENWLKALHQLGYKTAVCYSWGEAQRVILAYLENRSDVDD